MTLKSVKFSLNDQTYNMEGEIYVRTFNLTLVAAFILSTFTTPTVAQNQETDDTAMLAALVQDMNGSTAGSGDIRLEIEARIRSIMTEMQSAPSQAAGSSITIEEIDRINRSAELERTELEFERARFDRSKLEIERS